jgi:hypothetical protein
MGYVRDMILWVLYGESQGSAALPDEVRDASHNLSNAAAELHGAIKEFEEKDVLEIFVKEMRER